MRRLVLRAPRLAPNAAGRLPAFAIAFVCWLPGFAVGIGAQPGYSLLEGADVYKRQV